MWSTYTTCSQNIHIYEIKQIIKKIVTKHAKQNLPPTRQKSVARSPRQQQMQTVGSKEGGTWIDTFEEQSQ